MSYRWVVFIVLAVVLANIRNNGWFMAFLVPAFMIVFIPISIAAGSYPSKLDYPEQAKVTMNGDGGTTTIYFSQFKQSVNQVEIDEYCIRAFHWTNFMTYNVVYTPLTIELTDNNSRFLYTDRATRMVHNDGSMATQP